MYMYIILCAVYYALCMHCTMHVHCCHVTSFCARHMADLRSRMRTSIYSPGGRLHRVPRVLSHNFYNPQSRLGPPSLLSTEPQSHGASGNLFSLARARFRGNQNAHLGQRRRISASSPGPFSPSSGRGYSKVDCHRIDRENNLAGQRREENERMDRRGMRFASRFL